VKRMQADVACVALFILNSSLLTYFSYPDHHIQKEDVMKRLLILLIGIVLSTVTAGFAQQDVEGSADHPLVTRMPGFYIGEYTTHDFESYESGYVETGKDHIWEGKYTNISYSLKEGSREPSMTAIVRNYENAIKKIGGTVMAKGDRYLEAKVQKNGGTTYVHVEAYNDGSLYSLIIVESKEMAQDIVADANALGASITESGKVAVYGILFDTGLAVVKPESGPTLDEIAKLLKQNASLQLYVVGHTDNVGALPANLKLSADRADAVVKALVTKGVAASRLKAAGSGPYCPVASNKTEEGRAKNRRVELVQQ
jgi:OmpA-OmpF porin, OOP family